MGQFKPMVKMTTTEPSVMLKLKKGGHAKMPKMAMGGNAPGFKKMAATRGALEALADTPALIGRPAVNAPVRAPGKPSMAERRKAMMAKPAMPGMKEGGKSDMAQDKAMIKKAMKQHDAQEHKGDKGTKLALKKGGEANCYADGGAITAPMAKTTVGKQAATPYVQTAMRSTKKMATGGVVMGNGGGYKTGGTVDDSAAAPYVKTAMRIVKKATGGVVMGNGGGYATGGVAMSNAGGYKKGGASKKFARGGSVVDDGKAEAMPQGSKPAPAPKTQVNLSGAYKKGGSVINKKLDQVFQSENAPEMKDAKTMSRLQYKTSEGSGPSWKAPRFK